VKTLSTTVVTHANGSDEVVFSPAFVCLSVCLSVYPEDISKTDKARITKLDVQMFHDESWKTTYFGVKTSKKKVESHKIIAGLGLCTLVSAGFF